MPTVIQDYARTEKTLYTSMIFVLEEIEEQPARPRSFNESQLRPKVPLSLIAAHRTEPMKIRIRSARAHKSGYQWPPFCTLSCILAYLYFVIDRAFSFHI